MEVLLQISNLKGLLNLKYKNKIKYFFMQKYYYFKYIRHLFMKKKHIFTFKDLNRLSELLLIYSDEYKFEDSFNNYSYAEGKVFNNINGYIKMSNRFYDLSIRLNHKFNNEILIMIENDDKYYNIQMFNTIECTNNKYIINIVNTICIDCYNSLLRDFWNDNILIK